MLLFYKKEKEKVLTERQRLVPRVCPSSSKSPRPVVLRGKTHGVQIIPCQESKQRQRRRWRRRAPAFETEDVVFREFRFNGGKRDTKVPADLSRETQNSTSRFSSSRWQSSLELSKFSRAFLIAREIWKL